MKIWKKWKNNISFFSSRNYDMINEKGEIAMSIQTEIANQKESMGIHEYAILSTSDLDFSQGVRKL